MNAAMLPHLEPSFEHPEVIAEDCTGLPVVHLRSNRTGVTDAARVDYGRSPDGPTYRVGRVRVVWSDTRPRSWVDARLVLCTDASDDYPF